LNDNERKVSFAFSELGLKQPIKIYNIWRRKEQVMSDENLSAAIAAHGVVAFKIT